MTIDTTNYFELKRGDDVFEVAENTTSRGQHIEKWTVASTPDFNKQLILQDGDFVLPANERDINSGRFFTTQDEAEAYMNATEDEVWK
jgi:hypothetical protein